MSVMRGWCPEEGHMSGNHSDRAILGQLAVTRRTLLVACVNLVFAFCGGRAGGRRSTGARLLPHTRLRFRAVYTNKLHPPRPSVR